MLHIVWQVVGRSSVIVVGLIFAARLVGEQRPRDWLAFDALGGNARSIFMVDVPLNIQFDIARLLRGRLWAARDACALSVPAWSHDGRLALAVFCGDDEDILILDVNTLEAVNFTNHRALDYHPAWSHDGRLAFVSDRDGFPRVYIADTVTGDITRVANDLVQVRPPVWSSDGKLAYLGYVSTGISGDVGIYVRETNGDVRVVASTFPTNLPTWSPDGTQLAYAAPALRRNDDVFVLENGETRHLTNTPAIETAPIWLGDGRLSYVAYVEQRIDLYAVDFDTGVTVNITDDPADNTYPAWSSDGRQVAFVSYEGGRINLIVLDTLTGERRYIRRNLGLYSAPAWAR